MKRLRIFLVAVFMVAGVAGCGGGGADTPPVDSDPTGTVWQFSVSGVRYTLSLFNSAGLVKAAGLADEFSPVFALESDAGDLYTGTWSHAGKVVTGTGVAGFNFTMSVNPGGTDATIDFAGTAGSGTAAAELVSTEPGDCQDLAGYWAGSYNGIGCNTPSGTEVFDIRVTVNADCSARYSGKYLELDGYGNTLNGSVSFIRQSALCQGQIGVVYLKMSYDATNATLGGDAYFDQVKVGTASLRRIEISQFSYTSAASLQIPAELRLPPGTGLPAVVVVHGSSGIDSRGKFHIEALNSAGIATLEIDMWTPRGVTSGADRPPVPETLPDAYGALFFLAHQSRIAPERIGIMGFSYGGVVSMLTATKPHTEQYMGPTSKFKAHAPFYPVCWIYNERPGYEFADLTGAPVFIQGGDLDTYDLPETCPNLVQATNSSAPGVVELTMYPDATHAFDRSAPAETTYYDPIANLGAGGEVTCRYNPEAAAKARDAVVAFFKSNL